MLCVMYMIRNAEGLYWSNSHTFTDYSNAVCFDSRFQAHSYVNTMIAENKDVFGTDHLIVEEVICL